MKNTALIFYIVMLLEVYIPLTACGDASLSQPVDTTIIDTETSASESEETEPIVYEVEGDTTAVTESYQLMPIEPSVGIDWNSNIQEISTHVYYDICPYFDIEPLPDDLIAYNTVDGVKLRLTKVMTDNEQSPYYYAVTDVLYNDTAYHLETPLQFVLYRMWVQVGEDVMVIGNQSYSENSTLDLPAVWYILTETGVLRLDNNIFEDGYELKFDKTADGTVTYSYLNSDFVIAQQNIFSFCNAVTSSDQFIKKTGNVLYEDGCVVFEQTLYQNVNAFYRSNGFGFRAISPPEIDTIDKFIDYVNSGGFDNPQNFR